MNKRSVLAYLILLIFISALTIVSCSKNDGGDGGNNNPCSGVTITVTGSVVNASGASASDGSISANATGGSGFTFKINSGSFQSSGSFTGLAPGTYTITAKDSRGCSGSAQFTVNANDPCNGMSFTVGGAASAGSPCAPFDGSITASTSGGGTSFTYNINNGAFGSSPNFTNLSPSDYTIGAKESGGCVKTTSVTVSPKPAGPLFSAVRSVILANCAISGCHNGTQPPNFTSDCTIVANAALIKQRAVDGNPSFMPPTGQLPQSEKDKIVNWVNAGGKYTD